MTTPNSVWDEPELQPDGDYINFTNVGDNCAGTIQRVDVRRWDDGSVSPQLHLLCDDGIERTLTAGQIKLKAALVEQRPERGDHISITLTQVEKRSGGKTLKHFEVIVTRPGSTMMTPSAPPSTSTATSPQIDQAALAAAMANLTPEQKVALGVAQ